MHTHLDTVQEISEFFTLFGFTEFRAKKWEVNSRTKFHIFLQNLFFTGMGDKQR
jgi:hypothetical protein